MPDFELSRDVVDQVRDAVDILEVVGDHVRLRQRGRTWEGLCPFHEEKTPSFSVDPSKGLYYCFGCHRGGDVFKFVMELERLAFPEAVEELARRYGVRLPPRSPEARRRRQESERIRGLLEEAQAFFVDQLTGAAGAAARRELERRGFGAERSREFGFGWAPDEWRALTDHLARRHPEGNLISAGLTVPSSSGRRPYDRFRKRITFPIRSADGSLIGFGGRILGDGEPKYLNSPESPIFSKRATLFCLDRARPAIRERREAVVVEGYFDCLSLHRAGIDHVVATLGTALTREHAKLLRRDLGSPDSRTERQPRVVLSYDADAAGRRAALAGVRVLLEGGVDAAVVQLPEGTDPDDLIRGGEIERMRKLLDIPTGLVDFLVQGLPENPAQRRRAGTELAELAMVAQDPHTRDELLLELSLRLGFSQEVLRDLARRTRRGSDRRDQTAPMESSLPSGEALLVRIILEAGPSWRRVIAQEIDPDVVSDPRVTGLLEALRSIVDQSPDNESFIRWILSEAGDPELLSLIARITNTPGPPLTDDAIRKQLKVALAAQWRREARRLSAAIQRAEQGGDRDGVASLQAELQAVRSRQLPF
jgi:DNA primase